PPPFSSHRARCRAPDPTAAPASKRAARGLSTPRQFVRGSRLATTIVTTIGRGPPGRAITGKVLETKSLDTLCSALMRSGTCLAPFGALAASASSGGLVSHTKRHRGGRETVRFGSGMRRAALMMAVLGLALGGLA